MVAAQWGETRDTDARTGGGVSGRFRLLGDAGAGAGSGDAPDTTPPPFGTAPWGYRRSEVDAWASWVAGLVAHGRNETVRADSAEATLRATLERLDQLERPGGSAAPSSAADAGGPLPTRHVDAAGSVPATSDAGPAETIAPPDDAPPTGDETRATPVAGDPDVIAAPPAAPPGARTSGRLHFDAPADLPRRTARRTATPDPADAPPPADPPGPAVGTGTTAGTGTTTGTGTTADKGTAPPTPDAAPGDHDLARLHVVETTLHEVLELLHHLADRK